MLHASWLCEIAIRQPRPREPRFMFLNVVDFTGVRDALDFQYGQMGQTFLFVSFLFYLLVLSACFICLFSEPSNEGILHGNLKVLLSCI
jgi:hypothetical protein